MSKKKKSKMRAAGSILAGFYHFENLDESINKVEAEGKIVLHFMYFCDGMKIEIS